MGDMIHLESNGAGDDVELEVTLEKDDGQWFLGFRVEDEDGEELNDWICTDFNEMRNFFREMRELSDKFAALDGQTHSPDDGPAEKRIGALVTDLGAGNSGPGASKLND